MTDHSKPTYENQLWQAKKLLAESGREALNNPHAMIGKTCGCHECFCCAALEVLSQSCKRPGCGHLAEDHEKHDGPCNVREYATKGTHCICYQFVR